MFPITLNPTEGNPAPNLNAENPVGGFEPNTRDQESQGLKAHNLKDYEPYEPLGD